MKYKNPAMRDFAKAPRAPRSMASRKPLMQYRSAQQAWERAENTFLLGMSVGAALGYAIAYIPV